MLSAERLAEMRKITHEDVCSWGYTFSELFGHIDALQAELNCVTAERDWLRKEIAESMAREMLPTIGEIPHDLWRQHYDAALAKIDEALRKAPTPEQIVRQTAAEYAPLLDALAQDDPALLREGKCVDCNGTGERTLPADAFGNSLHGGCRPCNGTGQAPEGTPCQ